MSHKKNNFIEKLLLDDAEAVSYNSTIANEYLNDSGVDIEAYWKKGFKELKASPNKNLTKITLSKKESYWRRVVLAAKIVDECHNEPTFGSVKFQKLVYLTENVTKMNFQTHYTKQAAGPMDNKLIHAIKPQFKKLKWFSIEKTKDMGYEKVNFHPMEKINQYKSYYNRYFHESSEEIDQLIELFRKSRTSEVELVATIYACWSELIEKKKEVTNNSIIEVIYAWNKSKKKFSPDDISSKMDWMKAVGLYPAGSF